VGKLCRKVKDSAALQRLRECRKWRAVVSTAMKQSKAEIIVKKRRRKVR
jgi:hypothetical protein